MFVGIVLLSVKVVKNNKKSEFILDPSLGSDVAVRITSESRKTRGKKKIK